MIGDLHLIIFDMDGTLVDSQGDIVGAMRMAFGSMDLPAPPQAAILATVGLALPHAIAQLAPDITPAQRDQMVVTYKDSYAQLRQEAGSTASSPLYPHVRTVLEQLHAVPEILLAIATGKSRRGLDLLVDAHEIRSLFVSQHCGDDHPSKPHPAMIEAVLADTGVPPERAIMVGDSSYDMEMARAAGVMPVGVSWGYQPVKRLQEAEVILDDIRALPPLIQDRWSMAI